MMSLSSSPTPNPYIENPNNIHVLGSRMIVVTESPLIYLDSEPVVLPKVPHKLLASLCLKADEVVPYYELLEQVWDYPQFPIATDSDIKKICVTAHRLRARLGQIFEEQGLIASGNPITAEKYYGWKFDDNITFL